MKSFCSLVVMLLALGTLLTAAEPGKAVSLFDGKSFDGWDGNKEVFHLVNGAIVGGSLGEKLARNEFLTYTKEYGDFELRLKFKLLGEKVNAGVQIRSRRIPDNHEMIGYQADLGPGWWGSLYDESRRKTKLASSDLEAVEKALKPGEWNDYVIRCEGPRIRLWINGVQTIDYTEADASIEQKGLIGLQIHGGPPSQAWYKDITITELK